MFHTTCTAALAALAALGSFTLAADQESTEPGGKKQIANSIGMKLTLVPAGEFMMGSGESAEETAAFFSKKYGWEVKADWYENEHPPHRVRIARPFYLGTYPVTRGQFRQFVEDAGYKTDAEKNVGFKGAFAANTDTEKLAADEKCSWRNTGFPQSDEHPVVCVSWNDAVAFCQWLSRKEGKTYRLPTEAEWEYACRAGTTTRYYSGDDPETLPQVGNVADATLKAKFPKWKTIRASDGYVFTAPVGQFRPNAFGLYDMHGNALQWCADRFGAEYYSASPVDDPTGPDSGDLRVFRGGSWYGGPGFDRSADRGGKAPFDRNTFRGFRVARTEETPLRDRLQPVDHDSGLRIRGYFVWCGSVIKVDGKYHMFAARWPEATKFPDGYRTHSEIVRATASKAEGPYTFQEVVLGKRAAGRWDSGMTHNPAIYRVGPTFVLFYIGSDEGARYRQIGVATAAAIAGPWTRSDRPLDLGVKTDSNNPAACFEADGSVKLVWRDKNLRACVSTAPSFRGPYRVANDSAWPQAQVEDFFFFKQQGKYHLICEDGEGNITGHERWGAHLCSDDGINGWKKHASQPAYDHEIQWTDGTAVRVVRRERPWLLIEEGKATCLFTAVYDGVHAWNQPVPIRPAWSLGP
jgi:formylglycine-generating enzyme